MGFCGNGAKATQCLDKNVPSAFGGEEGRHRSNHMQVSSVLQQHFLDDLLLVAIDIRKHDSHRETVQDCCEINVGKISNFDGFFLATYYPGLVR